MPSAAGRLGRPAVRLSEVVLLAKKTKRRKRTGGALALYITGRFFKWLGIVLGTILLGGLLTGLFMMGYAKTYVQDVIIPQAEEAQTTLNTQAYDPSLSSNIYYWDDTSQSWQIMKTLYANENRVWITYDELPENLINATVAIEDKRFWEHNGVDWRRTLGAVYYMFTGRDVQGGSTITQQLIKNLSQNDDVTVKRKVLEIFSALEFDSNHSKEEILELYLNNIYLGRQCNGVYTAAYRYFAKDVSELDLAECASLISITNNPSLYDPLSHLDNNMRRASTVVMQMYEQGYISEEEELTALAKLGYLPDGTVDEDGNKNFVYDASQVTMVFEDGSQAAAVGSSSGDINSWYVDAVIDAVQQDLMEQFNISNEAASNMLFHGGLSIYTCFDPDAQAKVDAVYSNPDALAGMESDSGSPLQSAITVVDNETGAVVALSGGIGEKTESRSLVRATDSLRQPGSSLKAISVYAPALEEGLITPYSAVDDTPFMLNDGNPWPRNSNRTYSGLTSVYNSVVNSLNTSAVKTLDLVGVETSYEYLVNRFGISSLVSYYEGSNGRVYSDIDYAPLALGGLTEGVTTFEMAGAFSVFPRNGMYIEPHLYTTVTDSDGNVILENDETGTAVLSEDTCYYMNRMLEGVVTSGTGTRAAISGMTVAGKTGTTTDNYDRWFCGYTGYYTAAVWVGYDQPEDISVSGNPAVTLWQQVMSSLVEGLPDVELATTSKNVVSATYCTKSGDLATSVCSAAGCAATGYFVEGDAPTDYCSVHTTVTVCLDDPIGDTGMYHLAGEYCPEESLSEIPVLDFYRDEAAASVTVGDSYQLKSWVESQGQCTLHTEEWLANRELMSQQTVTVASASYSKTVGDAPFSLGAYSVDGAGNPGGAISYSSSNPAVATVDANGNVTVVSAGTAVITVTADATEYAPSVSLTVTVNVSSGSIIDDIIDGITGGNSSGTSGGG